MIAPLVDSERAVAKIFNSAIAAAGIGAAWEVGLLDAVRDQEEVDVLGFAAQHDLDINSVQGLASALAAVEVVQKDLHIITAGRDFDEAYRTKSLFHWLALGSGSLFSRMQYVLRNENRKGTFYRRDPTAISYACREANTEFFDPVFWKAMEGLSFKFHAAVDLGSGSGERLMQILDRYPGTTGIGVDIAAPAIKAASAETQERGLEDRLSFIEGDVRNMDFHDEFGDVDLLTCFMMGHDFWPRENCVKILRRLREAFPKARRFFLGDTTRILLNMTEDSKYAVTESDMPIFTLGFEFGHAMMGVPLPSIEDWEGVFAEGGWRCVKSHHIQCSLSVIFELERA